MIQPNAKLNFNKKNIEYCQTKEICQKVLKLIHDLLFGSKDAAKCLMFNEQHIDICRLLSKK